MQNGKEAEKVGIFREADLTQLAQGIIQSYHYETDFLSELIQNSVDSIRRAGSQGIPKITVDYNAPKGLFTITDWGTGMSTSDLKLFALGRTDKPTSALSDLLIGEKGVGGSYVLCISDFFEIESVKGEEKVRAICKNARDAIWNKQEPELEIVEKIKVTGVPSFTKISVKSVQFKAYKDVNELVRDLRTFTAIGNIKKLFGKEEMEIDCLVSITNSDDQGKEETVTQKTDFIFLHPAIEFADRVIWFDDLENQNNGKPLNLPDGIYKDNFYGIRNNEKEILAVFGREELLKKQGISPTILLGVKGAPMPVEIGPPKTGYSGYWRNLFIVLNRDKVQLDVGRKSIIRKDLLEIRTDLQEFFNQRVVKYAKLFTEPEKGILPSALEQLEEQARTKEDLRISKIHFAKTPEKGEELSVIGIFHEMIGAGILEGYQTLYESSDATYDAIIRYSIPISKLNPKVQEWVRESNRKIQPKPEVYTQTGFVEFKVEATEFMKDCDRGDKKIEQVMLVVAYDLNSQRIRKGWKVLPISDEERIFSGTKRKLVHEALEREVPVILLKEFRYQEK
jgi:hypothetical protein